MTVKLLTAALLASLATAIAGLRADARERGQSPVPAKRRVEVAGDPADAVKPIRELRPVSISATGVGKAPFFGAQVDVNVHPHVGIGLGYGYFSSGTVEGSFIPAFLTLYPLKSSFSPYLVAGADFITVKFTTTSSLLNSTFHGTQFIIGPGLEYRFDFGLVLRADAVRFLQAKIWSPGLAIGYSVVIF